VRTMQELGTYILAIGGFAVAIWILVWVTVRALGWARKGSPAATFIGWALLFLGAGTNPRPPPQEQVDDVNRQKRIKKDAESGDPED
jgi:hypothetical protein